MLAVAGVAPVAVEVDQALLAAGGAGVGGTVRAAELAGHLTGDPVRGGGRVAAVERQGPLGEGRVAGRAAEGVQERPQDVDGDLAGPSVADQPGASARGRAAEVDVARPAWSGRDRASDIRRGGGSSSADRPSAVLETRGQGYDGSPKSDTGAFRDGRRPL